MVKEWNRDRISILKRSVFSREWKVAEEIASGGLVKLRAVEVFVAVPTRFIIYDRKNF